MASPDESSDAPSMAARAPDPGVTGASVLLQLERAMRQAEDNAALGYVLVNESRRLIDYRQAVLFDAPGRGGRVLAVSGITTLDRTAPMMAWLARLARHLERAAPQDRPHPVTAPDLPEALAADWHSFAGPVGLWCPLLTPDGRPQGALWLIRTAPWEESDRVLVGRVAETAAHARAALSGRARYRPFVSSRWRRTLVLVSGLALLGALGLPVPQTALAPATVVAADAEVVAAPLDGVIEGMAVAPNQTVRAGDLLFRYDDTALASDLAVAESSLAVARAEARQARQGAFESREQSARIAVLEARVALREAELANARARMAEVEVRAGRDGVAVFADADDWTGRPVRTGEQVLRIADPASAALRIDLAVADAITLAPGAPVLLFPDTDPLATLPAVLTRASYEAEPRPDGALAYRVDAAFARDVTPPRLGLRGTARVTGETVPLALYLFRRPLAVARQWLGL